MKTKWSLGTYREWMEWRREVKRMIDDLDELDASSAGWVERVDGRLALLQRDPVVYMAAARERAGRRAA